MMKKVLFALAVLCTSFWSCNTLDLNDVGYGDGDRLKASSVKEILYGTADGCWKADYQGHEFYFQFHEDGTVTLDSDFLEMAVEGKTSFSAKGKEVALDIENWMCICKIWEVNLQIPSLSYQRFRQKRGAAAELIR